MQELASTPSPPVVPASSPPPAESVAPDPEPVPVVAEVVEIDEAAEAVEDLRQAPVERYALEPLLARAWSLRDHLHAYDALYVALAVELDCPLVTTDDRILSQRLPADVIHA